MAFGSISLVCLLFSVIACLPEADFVKVNIFFFVARNSFFGISIFISSPCLRFTICFNLAWCFLGFFFSVNLDAVETNERSDWNINYIAATIEQAIGFYWFHRKEESALIVTGFYYLFVCLFEFNSHLAAFSWWNCISSQQNGHSVESHDWNSFIILNLIRMWPSRMDFGSTNFLQRAKNM